MVLRIPRIPRIPRASIPSRMELGAIRSSPTPRPGIRSASPRDHPPPVRIAPEQLDDADQSPPGVVPVIVLRTSPPRMPIPFTCRSLYRRSTAKNRELLKGSAPLSLRAESRYRRKTFDIRRCNA